MPQRSDRPSLFLFKNLLFATFISVILVRPGCAHDGSFSIAIELPDKEKSCFYEEYTESKSMIFDFQVLRGGNNDVDVLVSSPNGLELYKERKKKSGEFHFETSRGIFTFCFSNEFSSFTHKVVYFELRPSGHDTLAVEAGKKKPTADSLLEHSLNKIHEYNTVATIRQMDYYNREKRGLHFAEVLHDGVKWWSMCQSCVILFVGLGQVLFLRALFSKTHPNTLAKINMVTP